MLSEQTGLAQSILAGVLRRDALEAMLSMAGRIPFLSKLTIGQLLTVMRIERDETGSDYDWIVFEIGNPDPAISHFE
jgi:hypothetical protein